MVDIDSGKKLLSEIDEIFQRKKTVIEPVWSQITEVMIPELADLDGSKTIDALLAPGYYDGKPRSHIEKTTNAIYSMMCGPGTNWIQLGLPHEELKGNKEVKLYLEQVRSLLLEKLAQDGFYDIAKPAIKQAITLGTSCATVTKEPNETRFSYINWHPGDYANVVGKDMRTEGIIIKQKPKIISLMHYPDLPQKYIDKIEAGKGNEYITLYFYFKKNHRPEDNLAGGKFPYTVYHILEDGSVIHLAGMDSLPGSMWLFEKSPRLEYGLCPGYYTLRDVLQSNKIRKYIMMEAEKEVRPPMWIPSQVAGDFHTAPGSINYNSGDPNAYPRRVFDKADLSTAQAIQNEIDYIVRSHFLVDFFEALTMKTNRKTALEVQGLKEEMGAQAAPLVYSVEHNFLRPMVKRTLYLMEEAALLPEVPQAISSVVKNFSLEVQFMGPLSQSNRYLYKTQQAHRVLNEVLMPMAQFAPDEVKDSIHVREYIKLAAEGIGGASSIVKSDKEVEQLQQERAKAQQRELEMQKKTALLQNGGKAPEEGSPLAEEMGQ